MSSNIMFLREVFVLRWNKHHKVKLSIIIDHEFPQIIHSAYGALIAVWNQMY